MDIGEKLKKLRTGRNWTQAELARRSGIDQRNISRYETGAIRPTNKTLHRFSAAFQIPFEELILDEFQKGPAVQDPELLELFEEVSELPDPQRDAVKTVLTMIVRQNRIQQMLAS